MEGRRLFLGLDCSTQSLSAILIDYVLKEIVYQNSLNFDRDFPQYKTIKGALRASDPLIAHSPPLMWAEALDVLFQKMASDGVYLKEILAISGSAQQHGSIYLNSSARDTLSKLDHTKALKSSLANIFARPTAPVWMDSSTTAECAEIREALGGVKGIVELTGSDALERFTGPQIRKFYKTEPEAYMQTDQIALVSSFLASLIAGKPAPIDFGDGSGMNLMDIRRHQWSEKAMAATAPDLMKKLPPLCESWKIIGSINPYFVHRHGFSPDTLALAWSGDNLNSLVGLGLVKEGMTGISLGTSFTYFSCLKECHIDPHGEGNLFVSPIGGYMSLNCFKNGALAIEALRRLYRIDWDEFNAALTTTAPGNNGAILLPYFEPEIIPHLAKLGLHRFDLKADDIAGNCRGIVEAQMMSMRFHAEWMKLRPSVIYATGGVSNNPPILQIAADIFNCDVIELSVSKSSALGAALRAAHGYFAAKGHPPRWEEVVEGFISALFKRKFEPNRAAVRIYDELIKKFIACERSTLQ